MSFGYSVGDIIAVVELAYKIYDGCKAASGEYQDIGRDVGSAHFVLSAIEQYWQEEKKRGHDLNVGQQTDLKELAENCRAILSQLQKKLDKHKKLGARGGRKLTAKMKWAVFAGDMGALRTSLQRNTAALGIFNAALTASVASEAADKQLKMLQEQGQLLEFFVTKYSDYQNGTGGEIPPAFSQVATKDLDEDKDDQWRNIDSELVQAGISDESVKTNRAFMLKWMETVLPGDGSKDSDDSSQGDDFEEENEEDPLSSFTTLSTTGFSRRSRYSKQPERKRKPPPRYLSKTYVPLPKKRGSFRLLNLRAGSPENPLIECELVVVPFTDFEAFKHRYVAVSWRWRESRETFINIRQGGRIYAKYVAADLVSALMTLRYPEKDRYLWLDEVCIDQENEQEKNAHLEMMSYIYGTASRVYIWLGDESRVSRIALPFIRKEVLQLESFDELCETERASEKWNAVLELMRHPWFTQRWAISELTLAHNATIYSTGETISWRKFAAAVELFMEVSVATSRVSEFMKKSPKFYHVPGWFDYVPYLGASILVAATREAGRDPKLKSDLSPEGNHSDSEYDSDSDSGRDDDASDSETTSQRSHRIRPGRAMSPGFTIVKPSKIGPLFGIEYLVSSFSMFQIYDRRNSIYSLLPIANDAFPSAPVIPGFPQEEITRRLIEGLSSHFRSKPYGVDYGRPTADVYRNFVEFCIRKGDQTRALDIICRPWAPSSESYVQLKSDDMPTPSWINEVSGAAYSRSSPVAGLQLEMLRQNADTLVGLPPMNQTSQRSYNAALTKVVDQNSLKFQKRQKMKHYSLYLTGFVLDEINTVLPSSQGGGIPREWVTAAGWNGSDPPDSFWRTLVADRGPDGKATPYYYPRACRETFVRGGLFSGRIDTTALINTTRNSIIAQFCRRVQAVIWNRSLITTQVIESLGLADSRVRKGDLVCILPGCSVPVILRKKDKEETEFDDEVEEDVRHWQLGVQSRLIRNFRHARATKQRFSRFVISNKVPETMPGHSLEYSKTTSSTSDAYVGPLREKFREKYYVKNAAAEMMAKVEVLGRKLSYWEQYLVETKTIAHNKRVSENRCYYELLGECYIHGMMDGEAIAYQNERSIPLRVFELR